MVTSICIKSEYRTVAFSDTRFDPKSNTVYINYTQEHGTVMRTFVDAGVTSMHIRIAANIYCTYSAVVIVCAIERGKYRRKHRNLECGNNIFDTFLKQLFHTASLCQ